MKKKSLLFCALVMALPFSLGVTSAWADDEDGSDTEETTGTTLTITNFGEGTATRNDNSNPTPETTSNAAFVTWTSTATPAITIAELSTSANNMEFKAKGEDTSDGYNLQLSEGSNTSYGFTITVASGYYISDMTIKGNISATDLKVTIDYDNVLSVEAANGEVDKTFTVNKPLIRMQFNGDQTGETFTITSLSLTVVEGIPDPVDLTGLIVKEVSSSVATSINKDTWYVISSAGSDYASKTIYEDGSGYMQVTSTATLSDYVSAGMSAKNVASYLIRFIPSSKESKNYTPTTEGDDDDDTDAEATTCETPVYHIQFATGSYWNDMADNSSIDNTNGRIPASTTSIGEFNAYVVDGYEYFGMNVYDLLHTVNIGNSYIIQYNSGYVTDGHKNDHWNLYEVTLEEGEVEEEEEEDIDGTLNIEGLCVTEVATDPTTDIEEGTWYMLIHDGGFTEELAYDTQDENNYIKAVHYTDNSKTLSDYVYVGEPVADAAPYLMRYFASSATSTDETTSVYYIQWATGNWWADLSSEVKTDSYTPNVTTSDYDGKGKYNAYALSDSTDLIGMNVYDLGYTVNLSAANGNLILNNTGKIPADKQPNDHWYLYEVKLGVAWKMTTAGWGTMILPFSAEVPSDLAAYTVSSLAESGDELSVSDAATSIESCKPYIVQYTGEEGLTEAKTYTFSGTPENEEDSYSDEASDGTTLVGTLVDIDEMPTSTEEISYYLLQKQTIDSEDVVAFFIVEGDDSGDPEAATLSLNAYHCYLSVPAGSSDVKTVINLPDTETAISTVEQQAASSTAIYDLSGRQVSQPQKGIYIKGGKKVIIK